METLRDVASTCCKKVHIGTALLPKPLFMKDPEVDGDSINGADTQDVMPDIKCATISTVDPAFDPVITKSMRDRPLTRYGQVLTSEFNAVVIEHHLKWSPLVCTLPGPIDQTALPTNYLGRYDFHHVDAMVDFAMKHSMEVKGHVLVWHVTSPPCLEDMSPDEVRSAVKRHIFTTMGYFRDRIKIWDVVNEALASDVTLAENVFYRKMGPSYIEQCFRWAHEADPHAVLIYNDNKVEGCGYGSDGNGNPRCKQNAPLQAKSDGFYNLLKDLVDRGVPVHGAGMQAHFNAGGVKHQRPPTPSMVKRQIRRIGELGLKVNISEMDVRVSKLPQDETLRSRAQTDIYRDILTAALSEPSFDGVWLWGFTDRHTWVKNFYYDDRPLIFSEVYERKESYEGVRCALKSISPNESRSPVNSKYIECDVDENGIEWGHEWMQPEPSSDDNEKDSTKQGNPDWLLS